MVGEVVFVNAYKNFLENILILKVKRVGWIFGMSY